VKARRKTARKGRSESRTKRVRRQSEEKEEDKVGEKCDVPKGNGRSKEQSLSNTKETHEQKNNSERRVVSVWGVDTQTMASRSKDLADEC
jgi:hypothetical protein